MGQEASLGVIDVTQSIPERKGIYKAQITVGGLNRLFYVVVPSDAIDPRGPLLINFHGGGGSGIHHMSSRHMNQLAEQKNFIVVYPNGYGYVFTTKSPKSKLIVI